MRSVSISRRQFRSDSRVEIGWGGRIRTSTVLINSEVSYRLDHAPAADEVGSAARAIDGKVCS
jgi:hypothetical protein